LSPDLLENNNSVSVSCVEHKRDRQQFLTQPQRRDQDSVVRDIMLTWYIYRFTYPIVLFLIKLSILLFYLRLASTTHNTFHRVVHATIALLCIYTITIVSVSVFLCGKPSNGYSVQALLGEKCLDVTSMWYAQSGLNLLTDVVILILPMPTLIELRIPLHRKLALIAVFSVGSIAVAAACIRVWLISEWSKSFAAQAKYAYIMLIGGQIELNAGIVCACIPFLKPLWAKFEGRRRDNGKV
jgi:hypothetical protein